MSDELNPYASPQVVDGVAPTPRELALRKLRGPSVGLLVATGLHLLNGSLMLIAGLIELPILLFSNPSYSREIFSPTMLPIVLTVLTLPVQYLVLVGAIRMRQLRQLKFCRIMAVISCVPGLSPSLWLGIPFGIWATVLLFRQDVAAEFDRVE